MHKTPTAVDLDKSSLYNRKKNKQNISKQTLSNFMIYIYIYTYIYIYNKYTLTYYIFHIPISTTHRGHIPRRCFQDLAIRRAEILAELPHQDAGSGSHGLGHRLVPGTGVDF